MNPTNDVLEKARRSAEGGVAALALASGQAASAFAIRIWLRAGDNVVSSTDLYGGLGICLQTRSNQGVEVRFVDPIDPQNFRRATDVRTQPITPKHCPTRN
jgi:O-acetylhomoserine (thiol)-lyase